MTKLSRREDAEVTRNFPGWSSEETRNLPETMRFTAVETIR